MPIPDFKYKDVCIQNGTQIVITGVKHDGYDRYEYTTIVIDEPDVASLAARDLHGLVHLFRKYDTERRQKLLAELLLKREELDKQISAITAEKDDQTVLPSGK